MNDRQRLLRLGAALAASVVLASACGSAAARQSSEPQAASLSATTVSPSSQPAQGTGRHVNALEAEQGGGESAADPAGPSSHGGGLIPLKLPWKPKVPVQATVTPACVVPGQSATLMVSTKPRAGVGYQAMYWGNRGGGAPPFGAGLGGNDKGFTDPLGHFTSSWTVSPSAPAGPARVDVIVGWNHKWGYAGPSFAVADSSGVCP